MKRIFFIITLSFIWSCTSSDPYINMHPHGEYGKDLFKQQDSNNDDVITLQEVKEHHQNMFDKIDRNQDGKMSRDDARLRGYEQDYNKFGYKVRKGFLTIDDTFEIEKRRFSEADSNNDGQITKEEFKAHYLRSFQPKAPKMPTGDNLSKKPNYQQNQLPNPTQYSYPDTFQNKKTY